MRRTSSFCVGPISISSSRMRARRASAPATLRCASASSASDLAGSTRKGIIISSSCGPRRRLGAVSAGRCRRARGVAGCALASQAIELAPQAPDFALEIVHGAVRIVELGARWKIECVGEELNQLALVRPARQECLQQLALGGEEFLGSLHVLHLAIEHRDETIDELASGMDRLALGSGIVELRKQLGASLRPCAQQPAVVLAAALEQR